MRLCTYRCDNAPPFCEAHIRLRFLDKQGQLQRSVDKVGRIGYLDGVCSSKETKQTGLMEGITCGFWFNLKRNTHASATIVPVGELSLEQTRVIRTQRTSITSNIPVANDPPFRRMATTHMEQSQTKTISSMNRPIGVCV